MALAITHSILRLGKQRISALLLALIAVIGVAESAKAQVVFDPALTYTRSKFTNETFPSANTDDKSLIVDLKLAYLFTAQGVYVGALYKHTDTSFSGGEIKGYEFGPSVGWTSGTGWTITGSYLYFGERKVTSGGSDVKFTDPRGLQLDLAYTHMFTPSFGFGPQLTYRNIRYEKTEVGGAGKTDANLDEESLTPYLAFHFQF